MIDLGKCISCGKTIDDAYTYCIYCGVKQSPIKAKPPEYITYFGGVKIKRATTTFVGFLTVIIIVLICGYFLSIKPLANTTGNSKISTPTTVDKSKDSTYVIKDSDKYPITKDKLQGLTKEKLAMARNEILARHGYIYKSEPYKSYFNSKSWYKPNPDFKGVKAELTPLERHNIKVIMLAEGTKPEANYDADYKEKK